MTTTTEYALLAGASYYNTRNEINRFPIPANWSYLSRVEQNPATGFEASAFQKGNEIVISYAGTGTAIDWDANFALSGGFLQAQLVQAAEYYLQIKAANPGASITLTGHSLGGGLASLVGVFFGEQAITFDQAPFSRAALLAAPDLKAALLAKGFTPSQLAVLTGYIELRDSLGIFSSVIPNAHLVTNTRVNGEVLGATYLIYNTIGTTVADIPNTSPGVSGIELHSQALLAAFLQSQVSAPTGKALNEVTVKLTDLLKMIFDSRLFATDTATSNPNFLEHLVRHESGIRDTVSGATIIAADAMVTRFTADLWKLAQDGGLTMSDGNPVSAQFKDVSKTLMAFAMQKYYEETSASAGYGNKLFSDVTGGVQFDILDVSTKFSTAITNNQKLDLNDAKGYKEYFKNYLLQGGFTSTERSFIQSMLPYLRDWTVQAGTNTLQSADLQNRGAFMLGGTGSDVLVGGSKTDLLVGNAGADLLQGRGGSDLLLGGMGFDTYLYDASLGDTGLDTILDKDGSGRIVVNGQELTGGAQYGDARVSRDAQGHTYTQVGSGGGGRLAVDGKLLVEAWSAGQLGLSMTGAIAPVDPVPTGTVIAGDLSPLDIDPGTPGLPTGTDSLGNLLVSSSPESGRADLQNRGAFMLGGTGNDAKLDGGITTFLGASHDFHMSRRCQSVSRIKRDRRSAKGLPIRRNKVDSKGTEA